MRILMLTQFFPPVIGGEERHVGDLGAALVARGHDVQVAAMWHPDLPAVTQDRGVTVNRLHGFLERRASKLFTDGRAHAPPFPDPEVMGGIGKIVESFKPDVVHAHNWMLHSFLPLKRRNGPRFVVTLHDLSMICAIKASLYEDAACSGPALSKCFGCAAGHYGAAKGAVTLSANWLTSKFERRLVDKFLPVSRAVARDCRLDSGPAPYEVVPNFVRDDVGDVAETSDPKLDALPREPYLLYVGDVRRLKGVHILLEAYRLLERAPPLVVIGRPRPDLPTDWPANVIRIPGIPNHLVMQAWRRCLAGAVPTVGFESCPTVVMEAMACGKPVVGSRIGGIPDIIDDGVNGLLAEPGDARSLAAGLQRLIDDPALRQRLSAGALKKVEQFKAISVVPRIEAVYREVCQRTSRS